MATGSPLTDCIASRLISAEKAFSLEAMGRDSAVLIPFRPQSDGSLTVVFTKRRDDLPRHAGEISFPGGRADDEDADLLATALRETDEELGIPVSSVTVIGALAPISTFVTDFAVYPFVGLVPADVELVPHEGEVHSVIEVALEKLVEIRERRELVRSGITFTTEAFELDEGLVWGATGRMLGLLLDRIDDCLKN
ncbi:MAG TPA: CoA pyrophosphatase [Solirubrobacterales bacterium]|jgi:8-oxo-dGTP pyrophosphatase MutT (NUDIX family)|nr:CoA pyrophosphatase [Solirubrobacterales bacterium]